jgi:hypothetical protein
VVKGPVLNHDGGENVVPLGVEPPAVPPAPVTRPGRLHGLSIAGIAFFALVGSVALFLFVTVSWPRGMSSWILGIFFLSAVGFMVSASVAVFSAARDTYATGKRSTREPDRQ